MALTLASATRDAELTAVATDVGNAGLLRVYAGTRPAGPGSSVGSATLLAELTCGSPFGTSSGGVLTLGAITSAAASTSGTAAWFRITTAGGTGKIDGSVTATGGGGDLTFPTTTVTAGVTVSISSGSITAGNA
jgi:hypothetical protein